VHCDTSTGVLNNIHDIGCLIHNISNVYNTGSSQEPVFLDIPSHITYIVDTVSTFGGIPINMCDSYIDILVTNPNKALSSSMGLGIIIGRDSILNKLKDNNRSYSLNLKRHYTYALKKETCNTCAIPCINALLHTLNMSYNCKNDVIKHHVYYKELYNILYTGIKYKKLLSYEISSPCIITILHENSAQIITYLFNNGYIVYPCKGHLLNRGFQISLYGFDGNKNNITNIVKLINGYS
jgi:2-aminoethylphosphonate-pyruvate transaminase